MATECIFCEIIGGRAAADIVYQDELTVAVVDPRTRADGATDCSASIPTRPSTRILRVERHRPSESVGRLATSGLEGP